MTAIMTKARAKLDEGALPVAAPTSAEDVYKAYLKRHALVSGGAVPANWTQDGGFWFIEGFPENTVVMRVDLKTGAAAPMFNVAAVRSALTTTTGHETPHRGLPFDCFTPTQDGGAEFVYQGIRWRIEPKAEQVRCLGEGAPTQNPTPRTWYCAEYLSGKRVVPEILSPDGAWFASVCDNNIILRSTRDGLGHSLTTCGTTERFWDIEAQRSKTLLGLRLTVGAVNPWAPDSLTLLAYRRDITGVFRMPRVNWLKPFEAVDYVPFQKAGAKLDRIEPVFLDVRSGRQTAVALESVEDRYIQLVAWHPNGTEALIIVYTRDFKRVDIFIAHRDTGAVRSLLTESAASFVKIQSEAMYAGAHGFWMLPDGSGFLWMSTRDGWNHLYRYDWNGQLIGQLTSGDWPVYDVEQIGIDGFVYFTAAINSVRPYDVHVCRVQLKGGRIEQLTREAGIHTPSFAPGGEAFLDTHSAVDRPVRSDLLRTDGTRMRMVSDMNIARFKAVGYTPADEFTVKAADGVTDLWGVLYKPFDFNPSHSYPVIEYIYGGPQMIATQRFFAINEHVTAYNLPWALAQLGYIVVCLDARGTPGRSKAFQDVVYRNWTACIADHAGAIRQLCERHFWMDIHRVGVTGHSWGGYYAVCALIQASETYHAAVSSAPGLDPWDMMLWEPYLDRPQQNRDAYDQADLTRQAHQVKGKLMLVVGTSDHGTFSATLKWTRTLIENGVDHEFVAIPQAGHFFADGVETDYYLMKLTGWFERHVKNRRLR
jgi:dipeptidyl-peptidase-4